MLKELKKKANYALELRAKYKRHYEQGNIEDGKRIAREYHKLQLEILDEVDKDVNRRTSIPIKEVIKKVKSEPKKPKIETGIRSLDYELVTCEQYQRHQKGGLTLGNFIQIAGDRGAGKTSLLLKIITTLSLNHQVAWFDFEMGERRVVDKLKSFNLNEDNLLYYGASNELEDIMAEVKLLHACGVNHFVIDSTMKIRIKGTNDRYELYSTIPKRLAELTRTLNINIYIINQISQVSSKERVLALKHGNDAEYEADLILFILKVKETVNGKIIKDKLGIDKYNESERVITCTKNRQDDRLFTIKIGKSEIFGTKHVEIEYDDS